MLICTLLSRRSNHSPGTVAMPECPIKLFVFLLFYTHSWLWNNVKTGVEMLVFSHKGTSSALHSSLDQWSAKIQEL